MDAHPNGKTGPATPAVRTRDLRLTLESEAGKVNILKGIDLTVGAGETLGIVGPSGSGKTSLLMVLGGLEQATGGEVAVAGHDLTTLNEDGLARFRRDTLGIVFQDFHLIPTMTALENVAVALEFAGRSDAFDRAAEELAAVGLGHRTSHYPGQLSGGEQQRVALARAFAGSPKLLLADEPTGNLDEHTSDQIIDLLFGMHERLGTTLLLVTHQKSLAERCGRMLTIRDGLVADDQTALRMAGD
ncbi:MAG TPA: ABC transporter [Rhodospirillaceae bacterium]|nr:ABC transporter [Magnetovibrio sp.]HBT41932.1 ABC transporter [Rhodospirillaceae bacterium]HCS70465.1 ABC transporter [Rhodospirillaceae bacterium]|tara:strand:+ start:3663 stop:4394 length:732 start_codon:yes stop_codon:yes gene_type:complete